MIRLLALTLGVLAHVQAHAAEINIEHMLTAIAAVESGVERRSTGDIRGRWTTGADGEVSAWQIHPSVLQDLNLAAKSSRIHKDPVYAESVARLWLSHLHSRLGNWPAVAAAWNAGLRGHKRGGSHDYRDRVMNIAEKIAKEQLK